MSTKKRKKATTWFSDKSMAQIYSQGVEFAFFNENKEQCHPFAFCKDFLQDAVWAMLNKKKSSIYSFSYEYGVNPPLDMEKTRLGVRNKGDDDFKKKCKKARLFLRELEAELQFEPSTLVCYGNYKEGKNPVFVFHGDRRWMFSPPMISLYSLAIRVGMTYEKGPWRKHFESAKEYIGRNDDGYTNRAKAALDKLIGKKPEEVFAKTIEDNYPSDCPIYVMHDQSGIIKFAEGSVSTQVSKNWNS